jgi:hypothetical protein
LKELLNYFGKKFKLGNIPSVPAIWQFILGKLQSVLNFWRSFICKFTLMKSAFFNLTKFLKMKKKNSGYLNKLAIIKEVIMPLSINQQSAIQGGDLIDKTKAPPPPPSIIQSGVDCGGR